LARLAKKPKKFISDIVGRTSKALGLDHMLERKPGALSGGQRQRVALGRAIVRDPKVFLSMSPFNLDAKMRVQMRTEISRLHVEYGSTMIYVTHDQVEAMTMGDRICVMRDGLIMQVADPQRSFGIPRICLSRASSAARHEPPQGQDTKRREVCFLSRPLIPTLTLPIRVTLNPLANTSIKRSFLAFGLNRSAMS
jgi:ABC-type sulfate/molybdate transport systems ATPase subunit